MKSRVEIYKTNFFINEEKKIVTCVIIADMNLDKLDYADSLFIHRRIFKQLGINNSRVVQEVGIAKCNPLDVFNIEKGKKIAESKAKSNLFKKVSRVYDKIYDEILNISYYYAELCHTCENIAQNEEEYLEKIIES